MTKNYVDKEAQEKAQSDFIYWQSEYNRTGDCSILWNKLEPLLRNAAGPNILKVNKHHEVKNFDEKVDDAVLLVLSRYKKDQNYSFQSLVTLMYWAAVSVCHNAKVVAAEQMSYLSYEDLIEKGMHESHVLSLDYDDISSALRELDKGDLENDQRRIDEDGPQTRVCNYRAISNGKGRVFVCTSIRTGEATEGKSLERKFRLRRRKTESR